MKKNFLYISIAGMFLLASCSKEDAIVPREDSPFGTRYEFPQGNHAYDATAKEIFDQFGIRFIYAGFDSTHLNRAWQGSTQIYSGKPLNDEQAIYHINFMKEQVFSFLKPEYAKDIFPPYLYLVNNYYYPSGTNKVYSTVYLGGVDFWVNSLFTDAQSTPPVPAAKLKETRVRILANAIKIAYDRKKINDAPAFHSLFDYVTEIKQYSFEGEHFFRYRGFLGDLDATGYAFSTYLPTGATIKYLTPAYNFKGYVFLCMRYTAAELQSLFPIATYPKIHQARTAMLNYFKDNYDLDLEAIAQPL